MANFESLTSQNFSLERLFGCIAFRICSMVVPIDDDTDNNHDHLIFMRLYGVMDELSVTYVRDRQSSTQDKGLVTIQCLLASRFGLSLIPQSRLK